MLVDIERAGGAISNEKLSQIRIVDNKIKQSEREIALKRDEILTLQASYRVVLERVKELYDESTGGR